MPVISDKWRVSRIPKRLLTVKTQKNTVYFEKSGRGNTEETLMFAKNRADELGIRNIVVASSGGGTGKTASEIFKGYNLVVVTSVAGYTKLNEIRMREDYREIIEVNGASVISAAHAFGGLGRAIKKRFGAIQVDEVIAHVLRLFSEGVKVGCEIACMAVDAGHFKSDEEVVAIGGDGGGADTAIVLKPSNTHTFFETRVMEIICKPRV
jgi:hypothetical protein